MTTLTIIPGGGTGVARKKASVIPVRQSLDDLYEIAKRRVIARLGVETQLARNMTFSYYWFKEPFIKAFKELEATGHCAIECNDDIGIRDALYLLRAVESEYEILQELQALSVELRTFGWE